MKNKEKYAEELLEIAISGDRVAIVGKEPFECLKVRCIDCIRRGVECDNTKVREWAESEADPLVDWSKVPIDAKVLVMNEDGKWIHRHFVRYENGMVYVYRLGCTSWSGAFVSPYKTAKLSEEGQKK